MTFSVHQALTCYMAAKSLQFIGLDVIDDPKKAPYDGHVHAVANGMDDCVSYASHKYINEEAIEKFMGAPDGHGVVGFWRFKDGTRLVYLCDDVYCYIFSHDDVEKGIQEEIMVDLRDFHKNERRREVLFTRPLPAKTE